MLYHPTLFLLAIAAILLLIRRWELVFRFVAIAAPIAMLHIIYNLEGYESFAIMNIQFISSFAENDKLIAYALNLILIAANINAVGNHRPKDIILGSAYAAFGYMALFAGDFISMFIALELMMIFSSAIIFIGGYHQSIRAAKKYFITHLMSGNMIVIGVAYILMQGGSSEIINATSLLSNPEYSTTIIAIMLMGMLINIASFPFSGWMVNYYPVASTSGFVYLISFTTKISVILLLKVFAGFESLKYIAIIMIIYSSIKASLENNLRSLLCLLSIMQMGFMAVGISSDNSEIHNAIYIYLFLHILYKGLLSLGVGSIIDHGKTTSCTELHKVKNPTVLFALISGILAMINIPASSTFVAKNFVSHFFIADPIYYVIIFLTVMTVLSLPWKKYFKAEESYILHLNWYNKIAIYLLGAVVIFITFLGHYLTPIYQFMMQANIQIFSSDSMKQLLILTGAFLLAYIIRKPRTHPKTLNLVELVGDVLTYIYYQLKIKQIKKEREAEEKEEGWSLRAIEQIFLNKLGLLHNQQTAILMVFTIFLVMLVTFVLRGI